MADRVHVVLRVRRALERRAQAQVAAAEAELHAHIERTREWARVHDARPRGTGTLTPLQLRALQLQGLASWSQLAEASAATDRACQIRDDRQSERQRRAIDRRASERMVERRDQQAAVATAAAAQRALDELTVSRWGRP